MSLPGMHQYITGGSARSCFLLMPPGGFRYTKGTPNTFSRKATPIAP